MKSIRPVILLAVAVVLLVTACGSAGTSTQSPTEPEQRNNTSSEEASAGEVQGTPPSPEKEPTSGAIPTLAETEEEEEQYRIITLLPRDAIPSIDNPQFLNAEEADDEYSPDEEVIGVVFEGEARAYSVPLLSSHEIVNDTVGGYAIAVTAVLYGNRVFPPD
jgi:hypothetical protein